MLCPAAAVLCSHSRALTTQHVADRRLGCSRKQHVHNPTTEASSGPHLQSCVSPHEVVGFPQPAARLGCGGICARRPECRRIGGLAAAHDLRGQRLDRVCSIAGSAMRMTRYPGTIVLQEVNFGLFRARIELCSLTMQAQQVNSPGEVLRVLCSQRDAVR